jgi:hypothetical protein
LAGRSVSTPGHVVPSAHWGVAFNHLAGVDDDPTSSTEWKLLNRRRINYWFDLLYKTEVKPLRGPIVI